jgi:hypothetical protein
MKSRRALQWSFALLSLAAPLAAGDGFGMLNKDFARMTRTHPPKVWLRGTRIAVKVSGGTPQLQEVAERTRSLLESEVLGADSRLRSDNGRPETLIEVTIVESAGNESWENRTVLKSRDTGRKDAKGRPVFETYEDTVRYKIVHHRFNAAYKVRDIRSNQTLDADTVATDYRNDFAEGSGAPDLATLEAGAVKGLVGTVTHRITPSREEIGALIPRGTLKEYAKLAEAGLWNKYLELMQGLPPRPKPQDDSYRQYAIGLAYEALGYAAETTDETIRYLQQAAVFYNDALDMNPGEGYFSQPYQRRSFGLPLISERVGVTVRESYPAPLERVKGALVDYQRVKEFEAESAPLAAAGGKALDGAPSAAADALTNAGVIEMVKAGLAEEIILTAIENAVSMSVDVSPKGLIELSKAKVSKNVIKRLQERAADQ